MNYILEYLQRRFFENIIKNINVFYYTPLNIYISEYIISHKI